MSNFNLSNEQYLSVVEGILFFHEVTEHKTLRSSKEIIINDNKLKEWLKTNTVTINKGNSFNAKKYRADIDQQFVDSIRETLKRLKAEILIDEDTAIGQIIGAVDSLKRRKKL